MSSDAPRPVVSRFDRMVDVAALVQVICGVAAFFTARYVLTAIGAGTFATPPGSAVAVTERYDALSRIGLWLTAAGAATGVVAAVKHLLGRRRAFSGADTRPSSPASPVAAD